MKTALPPRSDLFYFLCFLFLVAFLTSPFLLTLSMIGFVVLAISGDPLSVQWQRFWSNKARVAVSGIFIAVLLSGFYSANTPFFQDRLRVMLPFLVLPFAFANLPSLSERQHKTVLYALLVLVSMASIGTFVNYLLDYQAINTKLEHGQPMPTPINHIRFSLLIAFTVLVGIWLFRSKFHLRHPAERWLIAALTLFLFVFLHILSVRSGIAVFYLSFGLLVVRHIFVSKQFWVGLGLLFFMVAVPFVAYHLIPSFKSRMDYAFYDAQMSRAGTRATYSDGERIISLQTGLELGNRNPLLGIGIGNLDTEIQKIYTERFPNIEVKRPHNQFIFLYASGGIISVLLFTIAFFFPLFYQKNYQNDLFLAFHGIIFCSFMVEATLGTAIGVAFYLFFFLFLLHDKHEWMKGVKYFGTYLK